MSFSQIMFKLSNFVSLWDANLVLVWKVWNLRNYKENIHEIYFDKFSSKKKAFRWFEKQDSQLWIGELRAGSMETSVVLGRWCVNVITTISSFCIGRTKPISALQLTDTIKNVLIISTLDIFNIKRKGHGFYQPLMKRYINT